MDRDVFEKLFADQPNVMTGAEVCELLRLTPRNLGDMVRSGEIRAYRAGRSWVYPKPWVIDWLLAQPHQPPPAATEPVPQTKPEGWGRVTRRS